MPISLLMEQVIVILDYSNASNSAIVVRMYSDKEDHYISVDSAGNMPSS